MNKRSVQLPRVYPVEELDGFYIDNLHNRTIHITFETENTIVLDIYDTIEAAYSPVGETLSIIELSMKSGRARIRRNER